ncbi:hypothetical protein CBR_g20395 [Chara braunii]|uniref:histidine kinase n=1 Tax=Chara braunii TaxID=69332 RepID=A0A388JUH0_CHABU|nr:hypothetical protein CBR_g20395 [Chara braunii]|eukprot:GBG61362.1 hypothetical protein CBR_g20395 [Chara braunii]
MLKCVFCGHEFQVNQFVAARHFRQGKGCSEVTDEALVDIHYNSEYKMSDKFLQRIQQFEELHGPAPAMDPRRDEGGEGEMSERGGSRAYFASAHVSVRTREGADTAEAGPSTGKMNEREEGARPTAAQKRMRQNTIMESFSSKWQMEFKKKWLRFVYSQRLAFNVFPSEPWSRLDVVRHFRDLPGPVKLLWPSENEISDIETIVHMADKVGADLTEVRAPFYVTRATIMSDGRKSRDARPIVNFLAGGSRGVMLARTMNREGERDRAPDVLARWIKVFDDFPPKWVNAICTDSASACVAAANMLQGPEQRPEHRRITRLPCAVHVCNKMLSDIGCSGAWSKDIVVRGRVVVRFIKEHDAALHIFRGESRQMGLIYPCETRFTSVFAMVERSLAVRSALERTVDGDTWDASLVREAETYILSQIGFSVASRDYETACAQLRDFHTRRRTIAWGGRDGDRDAQRCTGDAETYESGCWWSRYGQCAPQLQVIALRVVYMWTCSSLAERNWVVHEGVQTKKRNRLEFEKVAKLVEISANVRLLSHQRAGCGFALLWTLGESLLDVEGGIGIRPSWKGTDESSTREELEEQRRSWQRDPCGSRAPPGDVGDVFGTQAATLHPYPQDDNDSEGDEDEPAGPATAAPAADERDAWSDPEDVRRRSGGDDLFVGVDLEEECGGRHESPLQRQRTTSADPRSLERERGTASAPSRGAESGIGHRPVRVRTSTTSFTALPTSTEQLRRQPVEDDRLQRLVRGPRHRLQDRLEAGSSLVQGDDGDRQGLAGRDGGALAGGGGGEEVATAVEAHEIRSVEDERIPMTGGGAGFSEFGDLGMPPGESVGLARGESESLGDISVGMQELLGQISLADPSSFSPAMRAEVMLGAEGDEDRTPPGETSAERLDTLDSRRAGLMAQRDPRTQELARHAAEERQRQLGTFASASVNVAPAVHTDPPAEVHDTPQPEAASAEVLSLGLDVRQGTHEIGLAPIEEPRSEPAQPPAVQVRPEETLHEVTDVPQTTLPMGSVSGAVQMSPGLEDIQTGQSVGVDDIRPSAQAEGIAATTGGEWAVAGAVGVGEVGVLAQADPISTSGGGDCAQFESLPFGFMTAEELEEHGRRDLTEIDQRILRSVPEEGKLPHMQDLSWGPASPSLPSGCSIATPSGWAAGGLPFGGSVAAASGGAAGDLPSSGSVAAPSGGAAGPSSPLTATPREGGSLSPRSVARRRRDTAQRARELLDTMSFDRTDRPWSETRRVTTASVGRQPGLRGASTGVRRRDVVASGFGGKGGGGGGSGGQGDDTREGAGGAGASAVDPPLTYGLREASIILQEPGVVTRPRQERHVPLDRRQEGETSGTDGLPMARKSRRRDDLAAPAVGRTLRGRRLIMDDDPDERPVVPEPSAGRRGDQRRSIVLRNTGGKPYTVRMRLTLRTTINVVLRVSPMMAGTLRMISWDKPAEGKPSTDDAESSDEDDPEILKLAWRTNVARDLLGFVFGAMDRGNRSQIMRELTIVIARLADELPLDIVSQSDEEPVPHTLSRTLALSLQWSACIEERWADDRFPSRSEYLDVHSLTNLRFFRQPTTFEWAALRAEKEAEDESEGELRREVGEAAARLAEDVEEEREAEEESAEAEEEEEEEEEAEEETSEEDEEAYSEYSEGEQSEEEDEDDEEVESEDNQEPTHDELEWVPGLDRQEENSEAAAQCKKEIVEGKRLAIDPTLNNPFKDPEPPKPEHGDLSATTSGAATTRRRSRSRSTSLSASARPPIHQRVFSSSSAKVIPLDSPVVLLNPAAGYQPGDVVAIRVPLLQLDNFNDEGWASPNRQYAMMVLMLPYDTPRRWLPNELELVEAVADQVAVALSHAAILEESIRGRRQLEEQNKALDTARREAEAAIQARNDFLAVMNHEMRTPMHAIIALASLLQETGDLSQEQRGMVETILRSSNLLANLINDVLDLSRLEDGSLQLDKRVFNMQNVFKEVVTLTKPMAMKKKLSLSLSMASDLPPSAIGDDKRLMQTTLNIVGNAVKFTKEGSVSIGVSLERPENWREINHPEFEFIWDDKSFYVRVQDDSYMRID